MKTKEKLALRRTVRTVTKRALVLRLVSIAVLALFLIVGVTYAFSVFFDATGSFTVKLPRYNMLGGLSLSETPGFERPIERITANPINHVYNISVYDLPENLHDIDGDHGTKDYIALTFYLRNSGRYTYTLQESLNISGVSKGVDEAIRFRIYKDGSFVDYAKIKKDGSGPEKDTTPFLRETVVFQNRITGFQPGRINKYTVVIWLEGDDPECVNSIMGGTIKAEMVFKVIESS